MIPGSSSCHKWTLIFMYASAEEIMASPKVMGFPSDLETLDTYICMHTQLCQILSFYGFFFRDRGRGRSLRLLQKGCDTSLCSLVIARILPPLSGGRKQLSAAVKVIEQAELFWPSWEISRDSQKFKATIKAECSMLTGTRDRIGSKADAGISSLFFLVQPALRNWDGNGTPSSTLSPCSQT